VLRGHVVQLGWSASDNAADEVMVCGRRWDAIVWKLRLAALAAEQRQGAGVARADQPAMDNFSMRADRRVG
jgi:hypothetical protein